MPKVQQGLPSGSLHQGLNASSAGFLARRSLPPHLRFFSVVNVSSVYST